MNTGIQRSSMTPEKAWTTTTPETFQKKGVKKNIIQILFAHKIAYFATANVAWHEDLIRKVRKVAETRGRTFIYVLSPFPSGWKIPSEKSIEADCLAVLSKVFPLYEVINEEEYHFSLEPKYLPVEEYLKQQGCFSHLEEEDFEIIQQRVDYEWKTLLQRSLMESFQMVMWP